LVCLQCRRGSGRAGKVPSTVVGSSASRGDGPHRGGSCERRPANGKVEGIGRCSALRSSASGSPVATGIGGKLVGSGCLMGETIGSASLDPVSPPAFRSQPGARRRCPGPQLASLALRPGQLKRASPQHPPRWPFPAVPRQAPGTAATNRPAARRRRPRICPGPAKFRSATACAPAAACPVQPARVRLRHF
jgi:hypothetical protein